MSMDTLSIQPATHMQPEQVELLLKFFAAAQIAAIEASSGRANSFIRTADAFSERVYMAVGLHPQLCRHLVCLVCLVCCVHGYWLMVVCTGSADALAISKIFGKFRPAREPNFDHLTNALLICGFQVRCLTSTAALTALLGIEHLRGPAQALDKGSCGPLCFEDKR